MNVAICADSGALACTKSGESPVSPVAVIDVREGYRVPRAWGSELNREPVQFRHSSSLNGADSAQENDR